MNDYMPKPKMTDEISMPVNEPPLSARLDCACQKANDALIIVDRIHMHLFGGNIAERCEGQPSCFEEALSNHNTTLSMLVEALVRLQERLGV